MQLKEKLLIPMTDKEFKSLIRFLKDKKVLLPFIKNRTNYLLRNAEDFPPRIDMIKHHRKMKFSRINFFLSEITFVWSDTPEGLYFWRDLAEEIGTFKKEFKCKLKNT